MVLVKMKHRTLATINKSIGLGGRTSAPDIGDLAVDESFKKGLDKGVMVGANLGGRKISFPTLPSSFPEPKSLGDANDRQTEHQNPPCRR
ncbi:MAG: hypothetical protein JRF65_11850 [Deltaproteobacteria bacterium]|nr:hypothetical protein [Deltaproteobacteria bacterium]